MIPPNRLLRAGVDGPKLRFIDACSMNRSMLNPTAEGLMITWQELLFACLRTVGWVMLRLGPRPRRWQGRLP